ncbi:asparagine synthase-related protein [Actinomadura decatromicini]|uniref:asparagine synthase (glutamine-hydrolyzing) n=1 Tax=Actinomadura decatromicini TaxID=2604572 RepID=A0A5D3FR01_9ACTN|nr:asparagine synthase-related protein [Actinomadura decatromicini]TYK51207.1 asparagine synthase [Actinomadura decatromicini]
MARGTPPGVIAVASASGAPPALAGSPVWDDVPGVRLYGGWRPDEVISVRQPSARLLVAGHHLADHHLADHHLADHRLAGAGTVAADFRAALESGDPDRLTGRFGACLILIVRLPRPGEPPYACEFQARTDLAGQFPLYSSGRAGETVVGTHPNLVAEAHGRGFDPLSFAGRIACPHVMPLWGDRSPYQDVTRLPSGTWLHITSSGRQATPGGSARELVSLDEGARELRAALDEAVRLRCAGATESEPVSADLSGGLDSTSVAFLAARHAAAPVEAVTYHHPAVPAADLAEASRSAALDSRLRPAVVHGTDDTLPYQALGEPAAFGEPAPGALAWRRSALRLQHAAAVRARLHLTGEGADALLGAAPSYLAELARPGSARRFAAHCARQARLRHTSAFGLAVRARRTAKCDPAEALSALAGTLARPPEPGAFGWPDGVAWWPVAPDALRWLTPRARADLADLAAGGSAVPGVRSAADMAARTELRHSADTQRHLRELGAGLGVAVHAPFLDDAVVAACLRVPASAKVAPDAFKPLLARAVHGLVPGEVLGRRTKGDYTGEDYRGARRAAAAIRGLLAGSRLADLGVVDPAAVGRTVDRLLAGVEVPLGSLNVLLATEAWLRSPAPPVPGLPAPAGPEPAARP